MNQEQTLELMRQRHSVRQYTSQKIEPEKREILNKLIAECNAESGLHIQIFYDEPNCFSTGLSHYGKFTGVENYIALLGPKSDDFDEKCGYYGEKIVLKAQEIGLHTCWVALTHGKSAAVPQKGEKKNCLITIGYGENQGHPHKSKAPESLSNIDWNSPAWFRTGMEAVMLAPTAINQQKFYFKRDGNKVSAKVKGIGTQTRTDLGIAKYHFEAVTGVHVD